jgi:hypothetical protein
MIGASGCAPGSPPVTVADKVPRRHSAERGTALQSRVNFPPQLSVSSPAGCAWAPATPSDYVAANGDQVTTYKDSNDANASDSATSHGGAIDNNVILQTIFWGSAWKQATNPSTDDISAAVNKIVNSTYFDQLHQYGYTSITMRQPVKITSDPPAPFGLNDVQDEIWSLIDSNQFPEPDDDGGRITYLVFMPSTTTNKRSYCGEHGAASNHNLLDLDKAWVGWIGYGSLDTITKAFTHELVESISDPEPDHPAWTMSRTLNLGQEIGDACNNDADYLDGVFVQSYWSQAQGACVIPFQSAPTITELLPNSGVPAGGTIVKIFGTNFDVNGSTTVNFGGAFVNAHCVTTTECDAVSPPGSGQVDVQVSVNHWSASATYSYVPSVLSISPSNGKEGDLVTIKGLGFTTAPGAVSINFGKYQAHEIFCYPGPDCAVRVPRGGGVVHVLLTVFGTTTAATPNDVFTYSNPPPPPFAIAPNSATMNVAANGTAILTLSTSGDEATGLVSLSIAGLPAGVHATFGAQTPNVGDSFNLTISADLNAQLTSSSTVTVLAKAGGGQYSAAATIGLNVTSCVMASCKLYCGVVDDYCGGTEDCGACRDCPPNSVWVQGSGCVEQTSNCKPKTCHKGDIFDPDTCMCQSPKG